MTTRYAPDCSFCGKGADEVRKIIAGPGIYICDECVGACDRILAADDGTSTAELPEWKTMADEKILDHLPRIAAVSGQVDASLTHRVAELRERGVTWSRIGAALGTTRQTAWERFTGTGTAPDDA